MPEYGVTDEGFVLKRLDTILEEVHADLTAGFGVDTRLNGTSFLNTLVTTFCNQIAELWETAQDSYYAKFPATATGVNLDNAVQYGGIRREAERRTCYPLHCTGKDGAIVREGTRVASDTNPEIRLSAAVDFTISRDVFNEVAVTVAVIESGVYTITVNSEQYSYRNNNGNATKGEILSRLLRLMDLDGYEVSLNDDALLICDTRKARKNALILSNNLTTESVTTTANFYTEDYGKVTLPNGIVTKFVDNVAGFTAVTNKLPPVYGRTRETDIELRQSYIAKSALRSNTMIGSIEAELLTNVSGVSFAVGFENPSNQTDARGLPPHSIEMIVEGGEDSEVASAILKRKAGGIQTYGGSHDSVTVNVPGVNGEDIPVSFSRPEKLYVWLHVALRGTTVKFPSNYAELVRQSLTENAAGFAPGDSLLYQQLGGGLYRLIPGLKIVEISYAFSEDGEYRMGNLMVTLRQMIALSAERITVVATEWSE